VSDQQSRQPGGRLRRGEIAGRAASAIARHASPNGEVEKMDKNRIKGATKQATGTIKEMAGKVLGNTKLVREGNAEKVEGKIQSTIGEAKDALKK
jgi:uncharacterized protein YjbJ (UPF0337 family)